MNDFLGLCWLTEDDMWSAYVLCLYFMVTIFATGELKRSAATIMNNMTQYVALMYVNDT